MEDGERGIIAWRSKINSLCAPRYGASTMEGENAFLRRK